MSLARMKKQIQLTGTRADLRRSRRQRIRFVLALSAFFVLACMSYVALRIDRRWLRFWVNTYKIPESRLTGFSGNRMSRLQLDLRKKFDFDDTSQRPKSSSSLIDLLSHSLINTVHPLNCSLNSYHLERYAPLFSNHQGRRKGEAFKLHPRVQFQRRYLIAINLVDASMVLPSLIRAIVSLVEAMTTSKMERRRRFRVSIYENGSADTTPAQLVVFAKILDALGVPFDITSDTAKSIKVKGRRIATLAELRNAVLAPLTTSPPGTFDRVLFINDVHLCEADILELMYSQEFQGADMSCGMDYKELEIVEFKQQGYPIMFYDTWVARDFEGLPLYKISQPGGNWELPSPAFQNSKSRFRFHNLQPIQAFSCWNGVAIIKAKFFEAPYNLRFRSHEGTDRDSECYLICKDIWKARTPSWAWYSAAEEKGLVDVAGDASLPWLEEVNASLRGGARIVINPRVAVAYTSDQYQRVRQDSNMTKLRGLEGLPTGDVNRVLRREEIIDWSTVSPPKTVATYPGAAWDVLVISLILSGFEFDAYTGLTRVCFPNLIMQDSLS